MNIRSFVTLCLFSLSLFMYAQNRPNIIWVITDEHNFRTLGCYRDLLPPGQAKMWGDVVVETPNIDRLADQGAIFTKMYTSSPVCSPNRASMFTGQYPQTVNVPKNDMVMDTSYPTIATVLIANGYQTGYAGKWHLSGTAKPGWSPNPNYGFQDNRFMYNRGHWKKFAIDQDGNPYVATRNAKNKPQAYLKDADNKSFSTDWLTDRMLDFIETNKNTPFFYVASFPDPHGPNTVRAPYNSMYKDSNFKVPVSFHYTQSATDPSWRKSDPKIKSEADVLKIIPQYYGMVKCIDDNIGRLLIKLEQENLLDNTIIMFSSDHGDMVGEHRRNNKGVPFEGSAKIPFLIHYPKGIKSGTVVHKAANATDWMETILSLAEIQERPKTAGRDLTVLLKNPNLKSFNDITFVRFNSWVAAFDSRYKLVMDNGRSTIPWLMDLKENPEENINYFDNPAYKKVRKQLTEKLLGYINENNDPIQKNKNLMDKLNNVLN